MKTPFEVKQRLMRLAREVEGLTWADRMCLGEAIALIPDSSTEAAPAAVQGEALTDERIDEALYVIDEAARNYEHYDYGLPMHHDETRDVMRAAVRSVASSAPTADPVRPKEPTEAEYIEIARRTSGYTMLQHGQIATFGHKIWKLALSIKD